MAYFADYSRVNSAVNGQAGYAGRLSGLSGTFSGNMNRLNVEPSILRGPHRCSHPFDGQSSPGYFLPLHASRVALRISDATIRQSCANRLASCLKPSRDTEAYDRDDGTGIMTLPIP